MHAPVLGKILSLTLVVGSLGAPAIVRAEEPQPATKPARDDPNRVICRRETVTGSLAQTKKICRTRAEWIATARDAQDAGQRMQEAGTINSCASAEPGKC